MDSEVCPGSSWSSLQCGRGPRDRSSPESPSTWWTLALYEEWRDKEILSRLIFKKHQLVSNGHAVERQRNPESFDLRISQNLFQMVIKSHKFECWQEWCWTEPAAEIYDWLSAEKVPGCERRLRSLAWPESLKQMLTSSLSKILTYCCNQWQNYSMAIVKTKDLHAYIIKKHEQ